jgi:hypothetical protein
MAFDQYKNWMAKSTGLVPIEHILSIDIDELQANEYRQLFKDSLIVQDNPSDGYVVGATNVAAKHAKGDILIYLSDDFDCPTQWDVLIVNRLKGKVMAGLEVNDSYQTNRNLLTIPIITRDLYDKWGFFWHPEFKSMFCDNFMYEQIKREGVLVDAMDLVFEHKHYSRGLMAKDQTNTRSEAQYNNGRLIFNKLSKQLGWNCQY